ncbi:hypothetical protein H2200_005569 [Cladophialophora chaetospira]|uniref:Uncharacterized protein n=1 Tax=Cladophialophora chaetospira TaxID=386627 RepID=A0AA38XCG5_9EURO|nr:hypothetical protein H2200_005569 [Cladophialophora chaetospira]
MKSITVASFLFFPFVAFSQSIVTTTDPNGNAYITTIDDTTTSADSSVTTGYASTISTSYTTGSAVEATPSGTYPPASTSIPAIQTVPFTGQALLVGTQVNLCNIARFTMLNFPDGGSIAVPLVGCSDDRPECCPSLNFTNPEPSETGSASPSATESGEEEEGPATSPWTATTPSPLPTGVMSMLSEAPLTVCPSDMIDVDPVCCPSGFQVYGQVLVGNYPPCVSTLTSVVTPGSDVLASITSAVSASLVAASTTTTAVPTVSVVVTQVFALGLPCADDEDEEDHTHLSTAAKAGIGAGVGVAALLFIGFIWGCLAVRVRRRRKMKSLQDANTAAGGPIRPESGAYAAAQSDSKHMSVNTAGMGSPVMQQQQPYGSPTQTQYGFSPAFGYGAPQMQPGMVQHDAYGNPYGIQPMGQGYPAMNPYPQSQSPPPPFYPSGGSYDPGYKPPAEVAGSDVHPVSSHRQSMGMSDTQSQVTSTTAFTGSHNQGGEPRPPAELSSQGSVRH